MESGRWPGLALLSLPAESTWDIPVADHTGDPRVALWMTRHANIAEVHWARGAMTLEGVPLSLPVPPWNAERVRVPMPHRQARAVLLTPLTTRGRRAGVVLLHGSHSPWLESEIALAGMLARDGLAVLIYDKRDAVDPQELPHRYTLDQLADDAAAALAWLRARPDVDAHRVGVLGISEGGWVAPALAARGAAPAFVITLSAPGLPYGTVERMTTDERLRRAGAPAATRQAALRALDALHGWLRHGAPEAEWPALAPWLQPWARTLPVPATPHERDWLRQSFARNALDRDPAPDWRRTRTPVLALWGADDERPMAQSRAVIARALTQAGNRDVTVRVFPGADHELALAGSGAPRLAPGVPTTLVRWLDQHGLTHAAAAAAR